jgi:peptide/nickel transport system permease protein
MPEWFAFLVRRLVSSVVLLLLLTLITFLAFWRIPSEPAAFLIDLRYATPQQVEQARHVLGADRSIVVQYGRFVWRALHGDLGRTWNSQRGGFTVREPGGKPVAGEALRAAGVTGSIVLGGMVLLVLISIPLGLVSASRPRSLIDRAAVTVGVVGISTHPIVVALMLQLFLASRWHLFAQTGYCNFVPQSASADVFDAGAACSGPAGWASHLALPWLTFAFFFVALYSRMIRARMLEVLDEPYIRTARAKGAPQRRVLFRHAMPNTMLPLVTMLAMDIGTAVGISTYIEAVYRLPGLGFQTIRSLGGAGLDLPMLIGIVLVTGTIIIVLNLVVDLVAVILDPRITSADRRRGFFGLTGRLT